MREHPTQLTEEEQTVYRISRPNTAKLLERSRVNKRFNRILYRFVSKPRPVNTETSIQEFYNGPPPLPKVDNDPIVRQQQSVYDSFKTPAKKLTLEFKVASTAATIEPIFQTGRQQKNIQLTDITRDRYSKKMYFFAPWLVKSRTNIQNRWSYFKQL